MSLGFILTPAGAAEDEAAFTFDGAEYFLRSDEGGILEYLTSGDTFKQWSTMVAIREYPDIDDPHAFAAKVLENVKASGPDARGLLMENKEAGSYVVDFLLPSGEGEKPPFAEWNVWRIEKKGDGIEAVQYAKRFYNFTAEDGATIKEDRSKIIGELAEFVVPEASEASAPADSASGGGEEGLQTYSYGLGDKPDFSMQLPAGWNIQPETNGAHIVSPDKMFTSDVVVVDSGDAADALASIMKQTASRYAKCSWNDGGKPMEQTDDATGVTFIGNDGLGQDKGVKYKVGVYLFSKEGADKSFVVTTWMPEQVMEEKAGDAMKMLSSVKLN